MNDLLIAGAVVVGVPLCLVVIGCLVTGPIAKGRGR
jgi:hypothetical protein